MTDSAWRLGDRYRVVDRIGSGGMADVLRAHDELLDRDVAVKVFRSSPSTPDTAVGAERQAAELRALARLNHPNLTVLYDGSIGGDGPSYLVMELIDGPSLAEELGAGPMNPTRVAEVGAQVADALAYVHAAGMVHRDVKPANILLGSDRIVDSDWARARLTDFGIVRLVGDEGLTQADMTLGSASYLAPEQTRGSAVGPEADVYALGLSLLEALTGHRAFEGPALEAAMARLTKDPEIPPDLPAPWPALLAAMTAREPAARPTAAQVAKILRGTDSTASALAAVPAYPVAPVAPSAPLGDATTQFLDRNAGHAGATLAGATLAGAGLAGAGLAAAGYAAGAQAGTPTGATVALPHQLPPQLPPVRSPAESGSWAPGGPPPPPGRRGRSGLPWVILAVVAVVALLALGIVLLVTSGSGRGGGAATTAPPSTPATTHPSTTHARTTHAPTRSPSAAPTSARSSAATSASSSASTSSAPTSAPRTTIRPSSPAASSSATSSSTTAAAAASSRPAAATTTSTAANP